MRDPLFLHMNNLTKEDLITSLKPGKCDLVGVMGRRALHVFDRSHRAWVYSSDALGYETLFEDDEEVSGSDDESGEDASSAEDDATPFSPYE